MSKRRARAAAVVARAAFDPTKEIGVTEPTGYGDPACLMLDRTGQFKDETTFRFWREAEIKHGRLAMLAALGFVAGTATRFPGFQDVPFGGFGAFDAPAG